METNELNRLLDDVTAGRRDPEALDRVAAGMPRDDLRQALDHLAERAGLADERHDVLALTRLAAELLVRWAVAGGEPVAPALARAAEDLFRSDLEDPRSAQAARDVAAVLALDPAGLSAIADAGTLSGDAARLRVLEIIATLGDDTLRERHAPALAAARDQAFAAARDAGSEALLARVREMLAGGAAPGEAKALVEAHLDAHAADQDGLLALAEVLVADGHPERAKSEVLQRAASLPAPRRAGVQAELAALLAGADPGLALPLFETALAVVRDRRTMDGYLDAANALGRLDDAIPLLERFRSETTGKPAEPEVLPVLARAYALGGRMIDAERTWRRLRAIDPRNLEALAFYETYLRERGDDQKLFTTLQFALSVVEDDAERIRIAREMAVLAEERMNHLDRAIEGWKRVLSLDPADARAEKALIALYEKTGRWPALVEFLNDRFRRLPAEAVEERVATLFQLIAIYQDPDRLPNPDNVLATYARVVEVSPTHEEALETLARGYTDRERWPDLLKVLQKKVVVTQDPGELLDLFQQIAEIAITRMSNETQAIPFLERVLELDPGNLDVVRKLKRIYEHKHNQEKLFSLHLRELAMVEGPAREGVVLAAAAMARDRLLRHDEALRLYQEAYRANPALREARENLHLLYARLERWEEYAAFLIEEIERPMPARRRIELLQRLGEIRMDRLGDPAGAREVFEQVLQVEPADDIAARRLEHLYLETGDLDALHAMFAGRGDIRSYVALLARREAIEPDPAARVRLNLAAAAACTDELDDPVRAIRFKAQAFALDPTRVDVGREVLDAHLASGDEEAASAVLRDLAPMATSPEERSRLWRRHRDLMASQERHLEAMQAGLEVLRARVDTDESPHETLARIREAAEAGGLWQDYAHVLEEAAAATDDARLRTELLLDEGRVLEDRLGFHDEARHALNRVVELDPGCAEALDLLERIALQQEDFVAIESVLRLRADAAGDPLERREVLLRLGRLYEDLLGDDGSAASCYAAIVADAPRDREALAGLHRTFERAERFAELADVIAAEIEIARTDRERERLQCELAEIRWARLDDFDGAVPLLRQVLDADPENAAALRQLRALLDVPQAREGAANALAPFYRATGRFDDLYGLLESRLPDMDRPERRAGLLLQMADIREQVQEDPAAAFALVAGAVALHPVDVWARRLCALADRTGLHADAARVLGRWVGIPPDGQPAAALQLPDASLEGPLAILLGRLYAGPLDRQELAVQAFEKAELFEGSNPELLHALLDLYLSRGDHDQALATMDRLAELAEDEDARRAMTLRKAAHARAIGRIDTAIETLHALVDFQSDPDAEAELLDIYRQAERIEDLLSLLEVQAERSAGAARAEVLLAQARVLVERPGRRERAAGVLRRLLGEVPDHADGRALAVDLLGDTADTAFDDWAPALVDTLVSSFRRDPDARDRLVDLLRLQARFAEGTERVQSLSEAATLLLELDRPRDAYDALALALAATPDDPALCSRTLDAAVTAGVPGAVADLLEGLAEAASPDTRIRLLLAVASVARGPLSDPARAVAIYDRLLELDPGSPEVLREMDALLSEQGRDAERIPLLAEMAASAASLAEQRALQAMIGTLCRRTGDFAGACQAFEWVLDRRPVDDALDEAATEAAARLLELYDEGGREDQAIALRRTLADLSADPAVARDLLLAAARGLRDRAPGDAWPLLDRLLASNPGDAQAIALSREVATATGDAVRMEAALSAELGIASDDAVRAPVLRERAALRLSAGDPTGAFDDVRALLAMDPTDPVAWEVGSTLLDDASVGRDAATLLDGLADPARPDARIPLLQARARFASDDAERIPVLQDLGQALMSTGRPSEAVDVLVPVFLDEPADDARFDRLCDALEQADRFGELPALTRTAVRDVAKGVSVADLFLRSGIALIRAGHAADAASLMEEGAKAAARHLPLLEALAAAYQILERPADVVSALSRAADAQPDPLARRDLLIRCGRVARDEAADADASREAFLHAVELDPLCIEAVEPLVALLRDSGDAARLRQVREREIAALAARGEEGDVARARALRRELAAAALEDGDGPSAIADAMVLVGDVDSEPSDRALARRIYERFNADPTLYRALAEALDLAEDAAGLVDLHRYAASLDLDDPTPAAALAAAAQAASRLDDADLEISVLADQARAAPDDDDIRRRLMEAADRTGRHELVMDLADRLMAGAAPATRFALARMGATLADRADPADPDRAAGYLLAAHRALPQDAVTRDALVEALAALDRHAEIAQVFESLGDLELDPTARCAMYFEGVRRLEDTGEASARNRLLGKVLETDPDNEQALERLEAAARQAGDGPALARWLARRVELAGEGEDRRALVLELADVRERQCNDRNGAIATLAEALDSDPGFDGGWRRLEALLLRTRRYEDLALMYEQEAEVLGERELKVAALKKAASIHESHLRDRRAAATVLRRVLDLDPANAYAFVRLGEALEASQDWAGLADLLRARAGAETLEPADRTAVRVRLGQLLQQRIGDVAGATEAFAGALASDPHEAGARAGLTALLEVPEVRDLAARALEAAFEAAGDPAGRRAILWQRQSVEDDPATRAAILSDVADLDLNRLHDPSAALDTLAVLLSLRPADAEVLERMEAAAEAAGRFDELYRLLGDAIAIAGDPETAGRLHLAAARIAEQRLDVPARAVDHYAAYLESNPGDTGILDRLERLYSELNRPEDQVRIARARLAAAGDDATVGMRLSLAELLVGDGADPVGALEQLRTVVDLQPDEPRAYALLRRIAESPVAGRGALEVLLTAALGAGDHETVLWAALKTIEVMGASNDTAALHDLVATTAQALGRHDLELKHLSRALVLMPSDEGLLARLLGIAARDPKQAPIVFQALCEAAGAASWAALEKSLLWQACLLAQNAGLPSQRIERCLARVLAIDPLARDALELADRLHTQAGRLEDLVEVLERMLKLDLTATERRRVLARLAELHETRRNPDQAAAAMEEAASLAPDDVDLLRSLASLRRQQGDAAGQADALLRLAGVVEDPSERAELLLDAASIQENEVGDLHAARASLERLQRLDPENGAALLRLERIYEKLGDYDLLVGMLGAIVEGAAPVAERVEAAMRAVSLYEAHLENTPAAVAMARRAFDLDPKAPGPIDELIRLYYQVEDWTGLVAMLRHKATLATSASERIALLRRATEVADGRMGDLVLASGIARQILEIDAKDPRALLINARTLEAQGKTGEALLRFQSLAVGAAESDERIEALVGLARLGLNVGDTGRDVRVALQTVLETRPEHPEAIRLYRRLLSESGDWAGLAEWLQRELKAAQDDADRASICMELADLHLSRLNNGQKFLEWAEEAHRFKRDNPRVVAGIVNFHLKSGERKRAIPYLEWLVNYLEGKRRLRELPPYAHELGKAFESLGDLDKAIQYYRLCYEHDAANVMNAMSLSRLYMWRDDHEKALRVYQPLMLRIDALKAAERIEVLLNLARIHVARDDRRKARQFVMRVLAEEPENQDAQALLAGGL